MTARTLSSQRGFTYIAALMLIIIMGIMLGAAVRPWMTVMKREREKELLYRGIQIRNALVRWHYPVQGQGQPQHPRTKLNDIKDLLKDPRTPSTVRYLRLLYKDPITGKDWNIISDPVWGVVGVFSPSEEEPLKKGGFPLELKAFEGKTKYSDWQFTVSQTAPVPVPGMPGSVPVPTPAPTTAPGQPGTVGPAQIITYIEDP